MEINFLNTSKSFIKIRIGKLILFYSFNKLIGVMTSSKIYTCQCTGLTQTNISHLKQIVLQYNPQKLKAYQIKNLQFEFESIIDILDLLKIDTMLSK